MPESRARNPLFEPVSFNGRVSALELANATESSNIGSLILPRCSGFAVRGLQWGSEPIQENSRPFHGPFARCRRPPLRCSRAALPSGNES